MIPENWRWVKLGVLLEPSKEKTESFSDANTKYIGLEHMQKDGGIIGYGSVDGLKSLKNVFHPNQILYGKLRPYLNKHGVTTFDGVCSTDILVFSATAFADLKYADYFLDQDYFLEYAVANSKGINLPRVSEKIVLNASCPLPPLPEQRRIVAHIDSLFARLDEAKEKLQSVMDGYELRRAAILHRAFTGELTAKWREERGVSLESWKQYPLISIFNFIDYRGKTPNKTDAGIPLITARNVKKGYIDYRVREYISEEEFETRKSRGVAAKGDILFTTEAPLGNAAMADCDVYTTAQRVIVLQQNGNVHCENEYVLYYMLADVFQNRVLDKKTGSTVAGIKAAKLKQIPVELPGIEEQRKILSSVRSLLAKEREVFTAAQAALSKIDLMKKSILARAFRGELGTNDPAEECAAVQKGGPSCCAYF